MCGRTILFCIILFLVFVAGLTCGVIGKSVFDVINGQPDEMTIKEEEEDNRSLSPEMRLFTKKYGLPKPFPVLPYTNHIIGYDMVHKNPSWVVQSVNRNTLDGDANRQNCCFKRDPNIPEMFSASNKDYANTNYSKGHLAPAGDNRSSQQAMDETFFFSNIVPQNAQNNKGIWLRLEKFCRKLTKEYSNVYFISGPLYLATERENGKKFVRYEVIGEREIAVPTHLYKVILVEKSGHPFAVSAFIVPNSPIPNGKSLNDFIIELKYLEVKLGCKLFPKINYERLPCLYEIENCKLA